MAKWKATGDGTKVGIFLPLPESLAAQFPDLSPHDTSPPHVTLLYVGSVPHAKEGLFTSTLLRVLSAEPSPIRASLEDVDHFVHPHSDQQVFYSQVRFSRDVGALRDRLRSALLDAGFEVLHAFPLAFFPHVTLGYFPDAAQKRVWRSARPWGTWDITSVAVWGLSKPLDVSLGTFLSEMGPLKPPMARVASRVAARWVAREDKVPGGLADTKSPSDFDPKQLAKGRKVEMEHTRNPAMAAEIAMDHLAEDPRYYDKLETIEKHARFS